ncbi:Meiotic recombination protein DMC1/LIM15 like protein [Argiope bruennichi]|uniref:Meiotic recombination protein DMC1/LIM15 homolog n=1 Tax=Argiope bruennichi TaxID=94029 RepID=A0A8T0F6W8_ARGBR|nr:Meiotic recombination protein DMC1/LIM15 like protein [Argiope bruennichi]
MIREPYDILTITKLYALIYGFDEEYIDSLGLTFADLKRKILKDFTNSVNKLCEIKDELLYVMKFSEKRKTVLSRLKEWEIEINSNSSVYVKVENNVDLTGPPGNFQFINNYISTCVDLTENPVVFCSCVDCYENQMECCSYNLDGNFAYNKKQCLQLPTGHPIYECNKLCKCDKNCINRVVQHGPKVKVAIFRTKNGCGWGLKTLEFIQKGQFVLEYLGEIITSEQAEQRGEVYFHLGRTYLFDMGFEGDCYYTIDAMLFGNASHFINHSCNPNLATYSVWINQQDPKLPRIALFAKKKIQPGEELTFDYKIMVTPCEYDVYVPKEDLILCKYIDLLQEHGINVADIKKLKTTGICTIKGLQMTTKKKLGSIKGLSEAKVDKIKEAASKLSVCGGIESMAITEAFGEFRTGKTQLAQTPLVTCQLPGANGYSGGKAMFIDTENTFRPDRLKSIADRFNLDHEAVLTNVLYVRAFTSEHQMEILDLVALKFHDEGGVYKLLVIDSIMALFRVDFCGRGELADRQQKLAQMLSKLQKTSEEYNVAVFVTNQMTADPGASMSFQADPKKPIGGHILAHASTTRISLRKGKGEMRIAKIYDSPDLPEEEATFAITTGGIADAKE